METRRRYGVFYTPTLFVDEAHKYIAEAFGKNWKEEYVVWDCACGTGNLTRDYKFKELYMSTLEQSDIDTANQMGYNPEAVKFQYDFLNDGVGEDMFDESSLPEGLAKAIEGGKKILFFINPPYGRANGEGGSIATVATGSADTGIGQEMKAQKWGACSAQLYAQFLYRIWKFRQKNPSIGIAIFCPPLFLSGTSFKAFRENFLKTFGYENGLLFQASHFSDVAQNWGISFTLWGNNTNKNVFKHDLINLNDSFVIEKQGEKILYNLDGIITGAEWLKNNQPKETVECVHLTGALKTNEKLNSKAPKNHLGYLQAHNNNIYKNNSSVVLMSAKCGTNESGVYCNQNNFCKVVTLFTARRIFTGQYANWINCKDEYLAPNESHSAWEQFVTDSLVYSLFNNSSQQSSLRQVDYKGKKWDIKNEFFWLSRAKILELAEKNNYDALYKDAKTSNERFVCKKLEEVYGKLSPDAKAVLDAATVLLEKSISMRKAMSEEHPEYHLDSFDAGWAQLKLVTKEYFKEEHNKFRELYKKLEDRLRPLVYELGFLKK